MFAKLKKKIENEGGGPALVSPMRRTESISSLPGGGGSVKIGPSPPTSITSETPSLRDVSSSKDELAVLLQKKSEQCKKMEGNISDLAALIKDKNKAIEKLESQIKQQDEVVNTKLEEQKKEFEAYRDKLIAGYQDEKLKMDQLLNTEEELEKCREELGSIQKQHLAAAAQVEKLTDEIVPLRQKYSAALTDNEKLKEESQERAELITKLTKEKAAFDKRLDETNKELTQKQSLLNQMEAKLTDLDGEHKTLERNSNLHRNKTNKLLEEKDEHIDSLTERVKLLEQRLSDSALSGDERMSALQGERDGLEMRLEESRQQLSEIKSTWSDKITHLEQTISHLNSKIVEDSEEMTSNQKHLEQMRENFHKQIEDMRKKLEDAEKRALENFELVSSKESYYTKQIEQLESEHSREKLTQMDVETQLRAKIDSLESQILEAQTSKQVEKTESEKKISKFEKSERHHLERELKLETEAKELEEKNNSLETELMTKREELESLHKKLLDTENQEAGATNAMSELQKTISSLEEKVAEAVKQKEEYEKYLRSSEEEKGGLLERNADLYQKMEAIKNSQSEARKELQRTVELQAKSISTLESTEQALRQKVTALENQIEQSALAKAESGLYTERLEQMSETISSLENQLTDKARIVKKQEQTLKDLRVTLQRELKVQALPNDDWSDNSTASPPVGRKADNYNKGELSRFSSLPSVTTTSSQKGYAAVLPLQQTPQQSNVTNVTALSSSVPGGATIDSLTVPTSSSKPEKDVNIQYLKHVVLKFMLSRESEALQLIKAISMLLNFNLQEQELIRETLEWKMSWFGSRPPLGKGQTAKILNTSPS